MGGAGLFYRQTDRAPSKANANLYLILLIALKCQVTGSLIITHFPKLLIKIQETITFHGFSAAIATTCGADNDFFFFFFFWSVLAHTLLI